MSISWSLLVTPTLGWPHQEVWHIQKDNEEDKEDEEEEKYIEEENLLEPHKVWG